MTRSSQNTAIAMTSCRAAVSQLPLANSAYPEIDGYQTSLKDRSQRAMSAAAQPSYSPCRRISAALTSLNPWRPAPSCPSAPVMACRLADQALRMSRALSACRSSPVIAHLSAFW
jgi:hypothetical protein